jgi:hypothetical protein
VDADVTGTTLPAARLIGVRKEDIMGETRTNRLVPRRFGRLVAAAVVTLSVVLSGLVVGTVNASAGTAASAASCPTVSWGSLPKTSSPMSTRPILGVRAGRQACYDRLVIDLGAGRANAGFDVRYVSKVFTEGTGTPVPVSGGATIQIVVRAPAYRADGTVTYHPADSRHVVAVGGFATFRQVAYAGSFEGQTTFALGVRARLPMRVMVIAGPGTGQRLVIDVAHHW